MSRGNERYDDPAERVRHGERTRQGMEAQAMQAELRRRSRLSYVPPSALGALETTAADLSDMALCELLAELPLSEEGREAIFMLLGSGEVEGI